MPMKIYRLGSSTYSSYALGNVSAPGKLCLARELFEAWLLRLPPVRPEDSPESA